MVKFQFYAEKFRFKALFDIVNIVLANDNMHFRIPCHFSHKDSAKMQTLPMNRADLR